MIDINALKAAMDGLIAQENLAASKVEELTTDVQNVLMAAIAENTKQVADTVAGIQAEIDKVVPPTPPQV